MNEYNAFAGERIDLVLVASSTQTITADIRGRYRDGRPYRDTLLLAHTTGDRTTQRREGKPLAEDVTITGLYASIRAGDVGIARAQIYCIVEVVGKDGRGKLILGRDYVYDGWAVTLGQDVPPGPEGGHGFRRTLTGTDPGSSGEELIETVIANVIWRLISFSAVLLTGGDAATRGGPTTLVVDSGAVTARIALLKNSNTQAASLTRTWLWIRSDAMGGSIITTSLTDTQIVLYENSLPKDLFLREGDRIRSITPNLDATGPDFDNYSAPIYEVEEWLVLAN